MKVTECPQCHRVAIDMERYRIAETQTYLCPGCVADARRCGYDVVWIPKRMFEPSGETEAFHDGLRRQRAIIDAQGGPWPMPVSRVPHASLVEPVVRSRRARVSARVAR